ncbi:hypothetical protein [Aquimarina longa]|uniref:hypothetical protein n=1 Tax=Aquimarina longa TaxID=1080221 RepID=UPI0007836C9A|nr:hypothetical protein [Aquimarina longa]
MKNENINRIIETFLSDFNEMCKTNRKDFLLRERMVTYESGSFIKKYNVTYRLKQKNNSWLIEAVSSGFWIFKKRFLLLRITKTNNKINFSGLYTSSIPDFEESLIEEKLKKYIEICKSLPQNAFVNS